MVARYSQGLNIDEPLAMLRSGTTSYYEADGLGSPTSLSNTSGTVASTYTYDSFGNLVASSGSLLNNFRYTGREFDPETSLYYYRARYYDAGVGRFITEDPVQFRGGTDFYRYASNSPISISDPLGLYDYNDQQTQQWLWQAYYSATAGYFQGLTNIRNNSQGGGPYDFAHDPNGVHQGDTWTRCGVKMTAGDFGNYIAGFQAGAWDETNYGESWRRFVRWAEGAAYMAGIYYHISGQSDVPNDPWDKTGRPWITLGVGDGRSFNKNNGKCGCQ